MLHTTFIIVCLLPFRPEMEKKKQYENNDCVNFFLGFAFFEVILMTFNLVNVLLLL